MSRREDLFVPFLLYRWKFTRIYKEEYSYEMVSCKMLGNLYQPRNQYLDPNKQTKRSKDLSTKTGYKMKCYVCGATFLCTGLVEHVCKYQKVCLCPLCYIDGSDPRRSQIIQKFLLMCYGIENRNQLRTLIMMSKLKCRRKEGCT